MLELIVERNKRSYDFKADPRRPSGFDNNYKNNSMDWLCIYDGKAEISRFRCQSVANYCFGANATADTVEYGDTIAEGYFQVKCFVDPRKFHGEIHGIIKTRDIEGQWIDQNSMQTTANGYQNGRFLIHDRYSERLGMDSNYAWSAGCFILSSADLKAFNDILHSYKIQPGDILEGQVVEI